MNSRHPLPKYVVVSTIILPLLVLVSPASSSDYLFSIAQEAKPDGDPRLCTSHHTGRAATYACQDYQTRDGLIRLLFSGGRMPKAIDPKYQKWVKVQWKDYQGVKATIDKVHSQKFYALKD